MEHLPWRKRFQQVSVEIGEDFVGVGIDRVELSAGGLDAVLPPGLFVDADGEITKAQFWAKLPATAGVRGGVYFDDGTNATHSGIVDDGFYVGGGVGLVWGVSAVPG